MNDLNDLPIFDLILDDDSESKQGSKEPLDNVIQFRKRKNDEDK